ncbi:FAD/NAD-binding domain-containing protein [Gymnopus androsaceus JB14]|uniref:FAD/NAD-binding domain-containing protein n=1 Tax=Gymnopus androsaceus JB14 TaxID=1447944 RepID=A0A6A4I1T2_9AGAR|nr:FAD/NAD-binding domain-containing protein [Gymnopus androsaceus JB14]
MVFTNTNSYQVGGGISGLSAAYCLGRSGHNVTIVDQAPMLAEIGAGIQIGPNMSRLLIRWGLGPQLERVAVKPLSLSLCRYDTGEQIGFSCLGTEMEQAYGAPYYHVHRRDLLSMLYQLSKPYAALLLDHQVYNVIPSTTRPSILLQSGAILTADIVIGADGINSVVRKSITGTDVCAVATGDAAYRLTLPTSKMRDDPELWTLVDHPQYLCWMGPYRHISQKQEYNLVMIHPEVDSSGQDSFSNMCSLYQDWEPRIQKLHKLGQNEPLKLSRLAISEPMVQWAHEGGRVIVIGDACHPMLPYRAQGSAMAVEDAATLGALFSDLKCISEIPHLFKAFQDIRFGRITETQRASWFNRHIFHLQDGEEQRVRDTSMKTAMAKELGIGQDNIISDIDHGTEKMNLFNDSVINERQFSHDAELEVEEWKGHNPGRYGKGIDSHL